MIVNMFYINFRLFYLNKDKKSISKNNSIKINYVNKWNVIITRKQYLKLKFKKRKKRRILSIWKLWRCNNIFKWKRNKYNDKIFELYVLYFWKERIFALLGHYIYVKIVQMNIKERKYMSNINLIDLV